MDKSNPVILYLSGLLGQPVRGVSGQIVGRITDMIVRMTETDFFPPITGLITVVAGRSGHRFFIQAADLAELTAEGVRLHTDSVNLAPFVRRDSEVLLNRDVLDKQLVDINGRRVIRVNDVTLSFDPVTSVYRLVGVDVSAASLVDRLGLPWLARGMQRQVIPWDSVQFFATEVPVVKLKLSYDKLARLHPADLGEIINDLGYQQGGEMIAALADSHSDALAADTVEELDPELQAAVIGAMSIEDAADILDEMEPDEVADLLADLPPEQAADLLEAMEADEAADVRELLQYGENTAGGLMSTDYVALPPTTTVAEAIAHMRGPEVPEFAYYLYVIDEEEHLLGVISLRGLLAAADDLTLGERLRIDSEPITVQVDDAATHVAEEMVHYNLMAMPVLDEEGRLVGIVQMHDALERLLPEPSQRRLFGGAL